MQIRKVVRQGGSLLAVLPRRYAEALKLRAGDYVIIEHRGDRLEVRRHDYRSDILRK